MNEIIVRLADEDRARLDRLTEALERRARDKCVETAETPDPMPAEVREALAKAIEEETPTETPQDLAGEAEAEAPATTQAEAEEPVAEESAPKAEAVEPAVTLEQIQQKVVQLAAADNGAKKAAVREIVNAYAKKVSDLPEDKWAEVWGKLTELEVR